ncbi:IPT/TIG domain-containing protein, partial [Escherichia coli]|uniref:IPT/TIG domain-containing protein n=1 Tax=Escherichia coli TaxID=562 RepID=UPI0017BA6728
ASADGGATGGLCAAGGTLTLTGTGFASGATVTAGSRTATSVSVSADGTRAYATFAAGPPDSPVVVQIENPNGCSAKAAAPLAVLG